MSQEIVVPFALNPNGGIAATTDPGTQTAQHVNSLISTRPGERAMVPAYGVDLAGQLFGDQDEVATAVVNDVTVAIQTWEPSVTVKSVTTAPGTDPTVGLTQVEVDYVTPASATTNPAAVSTATVLVGGTVVEQVSP
jgi:phage baseplate assembly protein W